jgi:hypothetical protein
MFRSKVIDLAGNIYTFQPGRSVNTLGTSAFSLYPPINATRYSRVI